MLFDFIKSRYGGKKAFLRYAIYGLQNVVLGRYKKFSRLPSQIDRVVFVCKGNICRSALAEWVFKSLSDVPCCSLGVDTTSGENANERISQLANSIGVDLAAHKTTAIDDFVPNPKDLYVCMEPAHIELLQKKISTNRISLLGLIDKKNEVYIHDPYSACYEYADFCVKNIADLSSKLAAEVR
jgi:protein-tyrosine phosphatase